MATVNISISARASLAIPPGPEFETLRACVARGYIQAISFQNWHPPTLVISAFIVPGKSHEEMGIPLGYFSRVIRSMDDEQIAAEFTYTMESFWAWSNSETMSIMRKERAEHGRTN